MGVFRLDRGQSTGGVDGELEMYERAKQNTPNCRYNVMYQTHNNVQYTQFNI